MKDGFEHIEDFLAGNMTAEEEKAFKARMKAEPNFALKVARQKETHKVVSLYAKIKMQEKVKALHEKTKVTQVIPLKRIYAIAASIVILIAIGNFWYANKTYSNKALIAKYFNLQEPSLRDVQNAQGDDFFKQLSEAYSLKDYDRAIVLLSEAPSSFNYPMAQFHLGNLYLTTGKSAQAVEVFIALEKIEDKRYVDELVWLQALAFLQNNDEKEAIRRLEIILQNQEHSLHKQASELHLKLESSWRKIVF